MNYHEIDRIFPFVVWLYGILLLVVVHHPQLLRRGQEFLPAQVVLRLQAHRGLAWLCFWVGGLWALQEIWLT